MRPLSARYLFRPMIQLNDKRHARIMRAGFCEPCAWRILVGERLGFDLVTPVCAECRGTRVPASTLSRRPSDPYRAQQWATG